MSLRDEIASRLMQARTASNLDRKDAAESMGVPYQTYAAHENGNRTFDVETAVQYGRRFKVSLDWLLTGQGRGPSGTNVEAPITGDVAILSFLRRVDGLTDTDISVAFGVIQIALSKRGGSEQAESYDQHETANPRRVKVPSE